MKFATKAIRQGQQPDPTTGAVIPPVYQSATFVFKGIGQPSSFEYSRSANPTRTAYETCLASLEEAAHGLAFSSGMAAVDAVLSMLRPGERVVSSRNIYGGTLRLFEEVYKPRDISFVYVDGTRPEAFDEALAEGGGARLVWIETPANPLLQLVDVAAVAGIAHARGALLVSDNTFPSPYFQRPLTQGADIVLHSTTKYVSGHSDVIGGAVLVNDAQLHERIKFYQNAAGAVPGAWDCWLSLRGLKTLAVRMCQHEANALAVARFLESHAAPTEVIYPGLASHPQHELARRQMDGFGGLVTFRLPGGREQASRFVDRLKIFLFAESLGGVESLVCHPVTMSHATMSPEECLKIGITEGTLRLSVGIEDADDLIADLEQALA